MPLFTSLALHLTGLLCLLRLLHLRRLLRLWEGALVVRP